MKAVSPPVLSQIVLCGEKINAAQYEKARNIADMICFATMAEPGE